MGAKRQRKTDEGQLGLFGPEDAGGDFPSEAVLSNLIESALEDAGLESFPIPANQSRRSLSLLRDVSTNLLGVTLSTESNYAVPSVPVNGRTVYEVVQTDSLYPVEVPVTDAGGNTVTLEMLGAALALETVVDPQSAEGRALYRDYIRVDESRALERARADIQGRQEWVVEMMDPLSQSLSSPEYYIKNFREGVSSPKDALEKCLPINGRSDQRLGVFALTKGGDPVPLDPFEVVVCNTVAGYFVGNKKQQVLVSAWQLAREVWCYEQVHTEQANLVMEALDHMKGLGAYYLNLAMFPDCIAGFDIQLLKMDKMTVVAKNGKEATYLVIQRPANVILAQSMTRSVSKAFMTQVRRAGTRMSKHRVVVAHYLEKRILAFNTDKKRKKSEKTLEQKILWSTLERDCDFASMSRNTRYSTIAWIKKAFEILAEEGQFIESYSVKPDGIVFVPRGWSHLRKHGLMRNDQYDAHDNLEAELLSSSARAAALPPSD